MAIEQGKSFLNRVGDVAGDAACVPVYLLCGVLARSFKPIRERYVDEIAFTATHSDTVPVGMRWSIKILPTESQRTLKELFNTVDQITQSSVVVR